MRRVLGFLENTLRRYPWVIPVVTLVPCAYFAARGTNDLVAARLFAADTEALARPLASARSGDDSNTPAADHHVRARDAIIHRNVFDSDAGCLDCDAGNPDAAAEGADGATAPAAEEELLPPEACYRITPTDGRAQYYPHCQRHTLFAAQCAAYAGRRWQAQSGYWFDCSQRVGFVGNAGNQPVQARQVEQKYAWGYVSAAVWVFNVPFSWTGSENGTVYNPRRAKLCLQ